MSQYVTDDQGQIMVRDQKGNTKYFHINMINNAMLMRRMGFTPVPKPEVMEPKQAEQKPVAKEVTVQTPEGTKPITPNNQTAESPEAKRQGKPA